MSTLQDDDLIHQTAEDFQNRLRKHHEPGFGIFPSTDPDSNYFNQVWARDAAHASANYFVHEFPDAAIDSLATLFWHQRPDGSLPSRVEREYQAVKLTPGLRRWSKPIFYIARRRRAVSTDNNKESDATRSFERPVHEGVDFAGGEDTIPVTLIAAGELFHNSANGKTFIVQHFDKLKKAVDFFAKKKVDSADGLAVMTLENPDWADTIRRKGKLGGVNVWWARGLRAMADIANAIGDEAAAREFENQFEKTRRSVMEKIYSENGEGAHGAPREAFFRAEASDDRLDTVASIFGTLYFLTPDEAFIVEQTLKQRVGHGSGLQNFDPQYPRKDIFWMHRLMGQWVYHNEFVWPWVTLQNIQVKIKVVLGHSDLAVREQYKEEAIGDLAKMARIFKEAGGAYEVLQADEPRRGETRFYRPPQHFMGTMVSYLGAYGALKRLGWI
jgi:glycogen debranching enzyme